jgi:hypothetical protein
MGLPAALLTGDPEDELLNCVTMTDETIMKLSLSNVNPHEGISVCVLEVSAAGLEC